MANRLLCPQCGSINIVKNGVKHCTDGKIIQRFACKKCGTNFNESGLKGFHTPKEIITFAFQENMNGFSTRDIAVKIKEKFQYKVTHVAVAKWIQNNHLIATLQLQNGHIKTGDSWIFSCPCFKCLVDDSAKVSCWRCSPETCQNLTEWLLALIAS